MNEVMDRLVELQSQFAMTVRAYRELDSRAGDEFEQLATSILHGLRASIDSVAGLDRIGRPVALSNQMLISIAESDFADRAVSLADRWKDIWKLEACWNKEVQS